MKPLLFTVLMAIAMCVNAQDDVYQTSQPNNNPLAKGSVLPYKNGKVVYEIVDSISMSKADIYAAAKKWLSDSFKNAKSVIQSDNESTGQIIGKSNTYVFAEGTNFFNGHSIKINMSIQIDARDGKYRIRIYDIESVTSVMSSMPDIITPIEIHDYGQRSKKNRIEKWENIIYVMNIDLNSLLKSFSKSLAIYSADKF